MKITSFFITKNILFRSNSFDKIANLIIL